MVNLFRRFQQPLMILVTVMVIISFTWFYSRSDFLDQGAASRIGTIYGKNFSQAEYMREGRKYEFAQGLAPELWQTLIQPATTQDEALNNFIWNSVVLRREAAALGVQPTETEIETSIKALPFFQTNGVYDSTKYNNIVGLLGSRGMTPDALEELVADQERVKRLKQILGTTVATLPAEVRAEYELRHGKFQCALVRFKLEDFLKAQQISDEDAKKAYEEQKSTLKTDELRKVKYVSFTVENSDKPLVGKERVDAFQKLSEKAQDFMVALAEPKAKFEEVAAKLGAPIKETPAFSENDPPAELDKSSKAAKAAFDLTKEQPVSDAVQTEKGYFLLQLADITPAREKTFDEAKAEVVERLKNDRANEAMTVKAGEARTKIEAELKAGKNFADAVAAAGLTVEAVEPVSLSDPFKPNSNSREVALTARTMQPGQVSQFVPTMSGGPQGGILVFLEKKLPVEDKAFEENKTQTTAELTERHEEAIFRQWFRARRAAANVALARDETKGS